VRNKPLAGHYKSQEGELKIGQRIMKTRTILAGIFLSVALPVLAQDKEKIHPLNKE